MANTGWYIVGLMYLGHEALKRRVVIVYNPRSSRAGQVERRVLARLPEATRYEVLDTDVDDNAGRLAKVLRDGDLVLTAGGDATAVIGLNGAMLSGRDVAFAALPYGNFNDTAHGLGLRKLEDVLAGEERRAWALQCLVDGEHYRYGLCYFTLGMFAEATEIFDNPKYRKKLRSGKRSVWYSVKILAEWWVKNRRREFLPDAYKINGREVRRTTDYAALNSCRMARLMKSRRWFLEKKFKAQTGRLSSLLGLARLMVPSVLWGMSGRVTGRDALEFAEEVEVMVQGEGEYRRVKCKRVEIRKAEKWVKVIMRK